MSNYTCKKGFMLSEDEKTGKYVPFFIYVRGKDILWSTEDSIESKVLSTIKNSTDSIKYIEPKITTVLTKNGWEVTSFGDDRYEATKRIEIEATKFNNYSNQSHDIYTSLALPFKTMDDERFNITCTMKSKNIDLNSATFNVLYSASSSKISSVDVHLINHIFKFDPDREQNTEYNASTIFVRISGRLALS